jgi:hypothetical protein
VTQNAIHKKFQGLFASCSPRLMFLFDGTCNIVLRKQSGGKHYSSASQPMPAACILSNHYARRSGSHQNANGDTKFVYLIAATDAVIL